MVVLVQEEVSVAPPESTAVPGCPPAEGAGGAVPYSQALRPAGGGRHARGGRLRAGRTGETRTAPGYTQRSTPVFPHTQPLTPPEGFLEVMCVEVTLSCSGGGALGPQRLHSLLVSATATLQCSGRVCSCQSP